MMEQERAAALADEFETLGLGLAVQLMRPEKRQAAEEFLIGLLRALAARPAAPADEIELLDGGKPKVVVLCGSSRFIAVMAVCAWLIERDERAISMGLHLLPSWYPNCPDHHLAEHEGVAAEMDDLHLRKIDLADEIFVVDLHGYVGSSCSNEIRYAITAGKPVRYYTSDPIGGRVDAMIAAAKGRDA